MHRRQRAGHDGLAVAVERQRGPLPPVGKRAGDGHAARGDFDDLGAGAEMGAQPRIVRLAVAAPARDIFGKRHPRLAVLFGRPYRRLKAAKAEPAGVVAHRGEHPVRDAASLHPRRDHDFERADGGRSPRGALVLVAPADDRVPARVGQSAAAGGAVPEGERYGAGARHRRVGFLRVERRQHEIAVALDAARTIIQRRRRIVAHELRHRRLDRGSEHRRAQIGPLRERDDGEPLGIAAGHRGGPPAPPYFFSSPAMMALTLAMSTLGCSMPERSTWSSMPTRLSRWPQPLVIASVSSSSARLARRIGTPTSLPSPTASDTSLCRRRSAKSAGSYWPARNLPMRSNVRGRPVAPWRTASHRSSGATPALMPIVKTSARATLRTALVQLCTSLAIVPAPIGPM